MRNEKRKGYGQDHGSRSYSGDPEKISVPAIRISPDSRCRVIYRQEQSSQPAGRDPQQFYTIETEDHITYYGEIVDAYIIED